VRERGEISIRLIVAAAVAAGLVWTVPFVFLGREHAENVANLTGGSTASPTTGTGRPQPSTGPGGRASDVRAQAALNNAITVARVYFAETGSYAGFGVEVASSYDPSMTYTSGPAAPGVVSIRGVTPTTVVFVTTPSTGVYLCAAANGTTITFGRVDALAAAQCSGGW
jgi:hypothetical protein